MKQQAAILRERARIRAAKQKPKADILSVLGYALLPPGLDRHTLARQKESPPKKESKKKREGDVLLRPPAPAPSRSLPLLPTSPPFLLPPPRAIARATAARSFQCPTELVSYTLATRSRHVRNTSTSGRCSRICVLASFHLLIIIGYPRRGR